MSMTAEERQEYERLRHRNWKEQLRDRMPAGPTAKERRIGDLKKRLTALQNELTRTVRQISPTAMMQKLRQEMDAEASRYWAGLDDLAQDGQITLADLKLESVGAQCYFHSEQILSRLQRQVGQMQFHMNQSNREAHAAGIGRQIDEVMNELAKAGEPGYV